jgi:hypothetical protein
VGVERGASRPPGAAGSFVDQITTVSAGEVQRVGRCRPSGPQRDVRAWFATHSIPEIYPFVGESYAKFQVSLQKLVRIGRCFVGRSDHVPSTLEAQYGIATSRNGSKFAIRGDVVRRGARLAAGITRYTAAQHSSGKEVAGGGGARATGSRDGGR